MVFGIGSKRKDLKRKTYSLQRSYELLEGESYKTYGCGYDKLGQKEQKEIAAKVAQEDL